MGTRSGLEAALDVWRANWTGPDGITALQQRRLAGLLAYARHRSRFYGELYRDLPAQTDLRQLPVVNKLQLMARFDDWVTDPGVTLAGVRWFVGSPQRVGTLFLDRYLVWTTSGTTGEPAILVCDPRTVSVYSALATLRAFGAWLSPGDLWRIVRGGARWAGIVATGGHYAGVVLAQRSQLKAPWRQNLTRTYSVLSPLPELTRELNGFQPVLLGAYATVLSVLADEQAAGRLRIRPALLASAAEWLAPAERRRIASVFDCPVRDTYGSSEFVPMAFDCHSGWLHLNGDWVILEPVDEAYQPVPPGQTSHTALVTNLANQVQPIIRYNLGDRVTLKPNPCACGSPLPALRVEGRTDEVLAFSAPDGMAIRLLPMALSSVVEETPGVQRFQLIQSGPRTIRVRLEPSPGAETTPTWQSVQQRLMDYLAEQGLAVVTVDFDPTPPMREPRSGKLRHVYSEV